VEELLTDTTQELTGFPTTEPAFGRRAHWVGLAESKRAAALEYLVLTPMQALLMHLDETIRRHAHEMLALDDTQLMLDHLAEKMPHSVGAVIPMKVELAEYHLLLKNLLRERVSIRDQATILETVAHAVKPPQLDVMAPTPLYFNVLVDAHQQFLHQQMEKLMGVMPKLQSRNDPGMLLEKVRIGLSRSICAEAANDQGVVEVLTFDRRAEELLLELLDESPNGQDLLLPGSLHELLTKRLLGACERSGVEVLLVNARLRPHLKRLTSRNLPCLSVISHAEVHPDYRVQAIDTLALVEN
jgi:flagellar biosynthesis protein FlhA